MPDLSSDTQASGLTDALVDAIKSGSTLAPEPFLGLPLTDGFRVQADVFHALGKPLKGSKLNIKSDGCHSAPLLWVTDADHHPYNPGIGIEVELAFVLGKDIAGEAGSVTRQDIVDSITAVRIGVELCRSRYVGGARGDHTLAAADMMSNEGYVLGTPLDRNLLDQGAAVGQLVIKIDGEVVFDKPGVHADGDPLKTMVALANQVPFTTFSMLEAGQVITTGSLCGMVAVPGPCKMEISMAGQEFVLMLD